MIPLWLMIPLAVLMYFGLGIALLPATVRIFRFMDGVDVEDKNRKTRITPGGVYALVIFWWFFIGITLVFFGVAAACLPFVGLVKALQLMRVTRIFSAPVLFARMTAPENVTIDETKRERELRWSTGSGAH